MFCRLSYSKHILLISKYSQYRPVALMRAQEYNRSIPHSYTYPKSFSNGARNEATVQKGGTRNTKHG